MDDELTNDVVLKLQARKGDWKKIAGAIPGVSYSWISQVGRGKYTSAPSYARLKRVAAYLNGRAA